MTRDELLKSIDQTRKLVKIDAEILTKLEDQLAALDQNLPANDIVLERLRSLMSDLYGKMYTVNLSFVETFDNIIFTIRVKK